LLDAWPNSSLVADEAVAAARALRGEIVAPDAGWSVEDFAVALDARIPHVKGALCTYKAGVQKLNRKLFRSRTKPIPDRTSEDVARNLKAARRQLDALLDSACRSGVQASLAIVTSWYPTIDLELLRALREHSEADVGAVWTKICHLASELTHAMDLLEYTPLLDDAGQPIPCSELSNMQYTSSEDTEGEAAPGDHAESSRSRYLDDEDGDDEEGAGSSAEHSETAVPPSTQAKATATSASDDAARTNPAAPTSGDAPNTEAAPDATGSDAPNA
jgi:hypothetical protein